MKVLAIIGFAATLAASASGCGDPTMVPLLSTAGIPVTPTPPDSVPLEVVTRSTAVKDPLPVSGTDVVYADMEAALGYAIMTAAAPWAVKHQEQRPGGWQLLAEVIQAEAEHSHGRLMVIFNVRATLSTRVGRRYLAQTQARCRDAGLAPAEKGGPIVYACMMRIGRDLAGWLGGLEP